MDATALLARYDRPIPRYTSYPTAPHFSPNVTGAEYGRWLGELPDDTTLSVYLHVPFCAVLCLFCACHTTVVRQEEPLLAYADGVMAEIDLVAGLIGRPLPVAHVHWGGGTPTALPAATMRRIMDRLRDRFTVLPSAEVAVEIDPRVLTPAHVEALATMGTNRVSLGVQDFNPVVQAAIGRDQSFEVTAQCVDQLRAVGIDAVNLDLIYGLPHQTADSVARTVSMALALNPSRAAVFGYAHVPWMKKHQSLLPEAALPGPIARLEQRNAVEETLLGNGYVAAGLDHFALPDDSMAVAAASRRLRRNFQGYTTDAAPVLIGVGASSIGSLPRGYVQNHPGVPAWRDAIRAGTPGTARGIALTADDRLRRSVIEEIMCRGDADLAAIAERHGRDPDALMDAAPALRQLMADGLITWTGHHVAITERGRPYLRHLAAAFDARLATGAGRHSAAV